jgi:hypothetical protein
VCFVYRAADRDTRRYLSRTPRLSCSLGAARADMPALNAVVTSVLSPEIVDRHPRRLRGHASSCSIRYLNQ